MDATKAAAVTRSIPEPQGPNAAPSPDEPAAATIHAAGTRRRTHTFPRISVLPTRSADFPSPRASHLLRSYHTVLSNLTPPSSARPTRRLPLPLSG